MKKIIRIMATVLLVASVLGFMGCKTIPHVVDTSIPNKVNTVTFHNVEYDIVEFGQWPQSKKNRRVKVGSEVININGWDCYEGSDGAYYVKVAAKPIYDNDPEINNPLYEFDDGTVIVKDEEYYFKLEPIQWRVLTDNYNGKKLLFAEKALTIGCFYETTLNRGAEPNIIYPNNYKESDIRAYLNSEFINKAFTQEQISKIEEIEVDNSEKSTFSKDMEDKENKYVCENTKDKVFLLSYNEATKAEYGFDPYNYRSPTAARIKKSTDYARAVGAWIGNIGGDFALYKKNSNYWLRSPDSTSSSSAFPVDFYGEMWESRTVYSNALGIVPAIAIKF